MIMMDGGGVIAMDGGSNNGQQRQHNGRQDGGAITMGNERRCKTIATNAEAAQSKFDI